jgi:transcriptional regulator with XRE-family HTH domain
LSSEQEFSGEQSRQIAALIREEIARRRRSRQQLADKAKLSLSTLEKVLGGRRPLTLATAVRVEEALGVSLRRSTLDADAPVQDGVAPDGLGAYSRRGVAWLEGVYVTVRPSFGDKGAIYVPENFGAIGAAYGRIAAGDARGAIYRNHLQRVTGEQFAMFLP